MSTAAYIALTGALVLVLALGAMLGLRRAARRVDDGRRTYTVGLTCSECGNDFKSEWFFGDKVRCPHCETLFNTTWDADEDDNVYGPWLAGKAQAGDRQGREKRH